MYLYPPFTMCNADLASRHLVSSSGHLVELIIASRVLPQCIWRTCMINRQSHKLSSNLGTIALSTGRIIAFGYCLCNFPASCLYNKPFPGIFKYARNVHHIHDITFGMAQIGCCGWVFHWTLYQSILRLIRLAQRVWRGNTRTAHTLIQSPLLGFLTVFVAATCDLSGH